MRTSHRTIRKLIQEEKSKITDEQLFTSRQFTAYMTDIVEAATKRYRRKSRVWMNWDTSEQAQTACTDNRIIQINAGNRMTQSFPTRSLRADSILGLAGHESGHILFTDFTMLQIYMQALSGGKFYPQEPDGLTPLQTLNLQKIKECFEEKDAGAMKAISLITHTLTNVMEDLYIEARMMDAFPGTFKTGILLNNLRFAEDIPSVSEQIAKEHHEVFIILNLLIQYAKAGDINNADGYTGKYMNALYECVPLLDDAAYDDDARLRYEAANKMLILLWPYMGSLIEQAREDVLNETENMENSAAGQLAGSSGSSGASAVLPSGSGKPVSSKETFQHTSGSEDDDREAIQKVLDYETGRMALEKTEDFEDGDSGGISYDREFAGSGYVSEAAEDIQRMLTQLAEENACVRYEEELSEELQQEAGRITYGNAHQGIHVRVNRMSYVPDEYRINYRKVFPALQPISKRLQKQVSQILKDAKDGGKLDGLPMGKRINARNLVRNDGKIFYKMKLPDSQGDIAVCLLIDESGSMSCSDRITKARAASLIIHDFCKGLMIPIAVYGHTEDGDVEVYSYAEYDSLDGNDAYRMMDMSSRCSNRDGAALLYAAERLLTRTEEIKLLILISDGQPAGSGGYHGTAAEADLRGIKQEYTRRGIHLFSAAIGDDKPNIKRIYGDGFLDISDLNKLPVNLGNLIIRYIKQKHAA